MKSKVSAKAYADAIKLIQRHIERLEHDIEQIAKEHIKDYHFLYYKVSTFWDCNKSPIGMCVFKKKEGVFTNYSTCRYCGGPTERK